jgi:mono/diheme cytochrome c family protein
MNNANRFAACAAALAILVCCATNALIGQVGARSALQLDSGEHIYKAACIACHGPDGTGTPQSIAGFERPRTFPDFTECDQTTPEDNTAWKAVITNGGGYRGFSRIMPSFKEALTSKQIDQVIEYLRGFCRQSGWPRGELNLPRAIATEKAFPEDELVISSVFNAQGAPGIVSHIIHEQRFGKKNQIEVDVPLNFQGSVIVPTGSRQRGFGSGTTTFETFAAFDQLFPTKTFVQTQLGADLPRHTDIAPQSIFFNTAIGQMIPQQHGLGRLWTPMMEFLAARDLVDHAKTDWDVLPQMQVTISKRQHVRADLGLRIPVTNTAGRPKQVVFYLLWDWFDGRLNEGW